jgi:hypothetical protein
MAATGWGRCDLESLSGWLTIAAAGIRVAGIRVRGGVGPDLSIEGLGYGCGSEGCDELALTR